jgi:uncharacterized protein (TIGR02594 family)
MENVPQSVFQRLIQFLISLFGKKPNVQEAQEQEGRPTADTLPPDGNDAPWLKLARTFDGLKEIRGKDHEPEILEFFRDVGHDEITNDETAWCAAFAGAMLERTGYASSKSLMAKSYISWGKVLNKPKLGAIAIFNRPPDPGSGHVGFYVGEDAKYVFVLGGNQSSAGVVNVGKQPKSRLIGYRWPVTPKNSRTVRAAALGIASTAAFVVGASLVEGLSQVGDAALPIGAELKGLSDYYPILGLVGGAINVLAYAIILYARIDDLRNKGR